MANYKMSNGPKKVKAKRIILVLAVCFSLIYLFW